MSEVCNKCGRTMVATTGGWHCTNCHNLLTGFSGSIPVISMPAGAGGAGESLREVAQKIQWAIDLADRLVNQQHAGKGMGQSVPCCPTHARIGAANDALADILRATPTGSKPEAGQVSGTFDRLPWSSIFGFLEARLVKESGIEFAYLNRRFMVADNGGEFNIFEIVPAYQGSIAYSFEYAKRRVPNGPATIACRIHAALTGKTVDYTEDVDAGAPSQGEAAGEPAEGRSPEAEPKETRPFNGPCPDCGVICDPMDRTNPHEATCKWAEGAVRESKREKLAGRLQEIKASIQKHIDHDTSLSPHGPTQSFRAGQIDAIDQTLSLLGEA